MFYGRSKRTEKGDRADWFVPVRRSQTTAGQFAPAAPAAGRAATRAFQGNRRGATAAGATHDGSARTRSVWSGTFFEWPAGPDWRKSVRLTSTFVGSNSAVAGARSAITRRA